VISSHILRSSGNKLMDRSVQATLDNVTFIEPFPEGSTERERTVTIEFNLEAKRTTG
jgi:TonB family protein